MDNLNFQKKKNKKPTCYYFFDGRKVFKNWKFYLKKNANFKRVYLQN